MKKEDFNPVKYYLANNLEGKEVHLWDDEIEQVLQFAKRTDEYRNNVGMSVQRINHNPRERAFHDQWLKENIPEPGINYGRGILQDLFITNQDNNPTKSRVIVEHMTNRDRMIVATVIQWLGTNCGMAFLGDALKRFDAKIVHSKGPYKDRNY